MLRKLFVPFAVSFAFVAFVVVLSGGSAAPQYLVDVPSLFVALVAPLLLALVTHGPRRTARSFACPFETGTAPEELEAARAFFACLMRYIVAFTVFAVVTGTVMLLGYLAEDNMRMIGRNLAVALLALFYGSVGVIFFVLPFRNEIDRRLALPK